MVLSILPSIFGTSSMFMYLVCSIFGTSSMFIFGTSSMFMKIYVVHIFSTSILCYIQNLKTQISLWGKSKYCVEQQSERSWEESESLDFSFASISLTPIDSPAALWPHPLLESLVWCDGVSDLGEEDSLCRVYFYWLECKVVGVAILNWDTHYWLSFLNC